MFVLAACGNSASNNTNTAEGNTAEQTTAAGNAGTTEEAAEPAEEAPTEVTIKHQLGEATVKVNPSKVVVFDNGVLDTLDKLGIPVTAVPKDSLPSYLEAKYNVDTVENAGTLFEPDFEKLAALQPEVIFISGRASEAYEELNKIAPTIYLGVDTARYLESFTENMNVIGQVFGKEAEMATELAAINDKIKSVNEAAAASGKKGLIVLTTGGKLSAYGKGSRFGIIHDVLGVAPADDKIESSTHGQSVTSEYIAQTNPDYLFVIDRDAVVESEGGSKGQEVIENDLVKNTNAYKNGAIKYLDPNYWYLSGGGLQSVMQMVTDVEAGVK
ncbi:siderophore ABC transporter substrate-binding protein [Paenibacillus phyllosphaerae]|nr:siderophore ABC transporter substrate-binding protein [Paenibacillus phyllosphaerae]